jgi:hypothetical protein
MVALVQTCLLLWLLLLLVLTLACEQVCSALRLTRIMVECCMVRLVK